MRKTISLLILFGTLVILVLPSMPTTFAGSQQGPPPFVQPGDIVLIRWNKHDFEHSVVYWTHAMLYIGKINGVPRVIHAWDVVRNESWSDAMGRIYNDKNGVENIAYLRLKNPHDINNIIGFADERVGRPYDYYSQFIQPSKQIDQPSPWPGYKYYCTELVWAAYKSGANEDIEDSPDQNAISGMEIYNCVDWYEPLKRIYVDNPGAVHPLQDDEC